MSKSISEGLMSGFAADERRVGDGRAPVQTIFFETGLALELSEFVESLVHR